MKSIVYLHGLNSTHLSFAYLLKELPAHLPVPINYNSHLPVLESVAAIKKALPAQEFSIVGHSLGGVIAALLAADKSLPITDLTTISSPLGGSRAANVLRWIPGQPAVIKTLAPTSEAIRVIPNLKIDIPALSIISTKGHSYMMQEPNDGVVTVRSQQALPRADKKLVQANHFEVLAHRDTVDFITDHIFKGANK